MIYGALSMALVAYPQPPTSQWRGQTSWSSFYCQANPKLLKSAFCMTRNKFALCWTKRRLLNHPPFVFAPLKHSCGVRNFMQVHCPPHTSGYFSHHPFLPSYRFAHWRWNYEKYKEKKALQCRNSVQGHPFLFQGIPLLHFVPSLWPSHGRFGILS